MSNKRHFIDSTKIELTTPKHLLAIVALFVMVVVVKMKVSKNLSLDIDLLQQVRDTGVPLTVAVDQALRLWLLKDQSEKMKEILVPLEQQ